MSLTSELVDEIRHYYTQKAEGHNDFPKFFVNNEHQAYMEGRLRGLILNTFPNLGKKLVENFYAKAYSKVVYCEQAFIEKVLKQLLARGFQRFFKTRYMVVGYDMYLRNSHLSPAAGIHFDLPNFNHFYETENDLSIYIPLVDLDNENGGRLRALPECKLKVPGNVLLKLLYEYFSKDPNYLDENGYVDPQKISQKAIDNFIKSRAHQNLMTLYKSVTDMAKQQYAKDFRMPEESKGRILLFNNKNFHAAEKWKNKNYDREIYAVRMFPIYDVKIKLKKTLHGVPINNFLLDTKEGEVHRLDREIDFSCIPTEAKVRM
uniref:Uncharacterized protein n=1 Tax=symbiont bacterium of Paederus fuscipes TaxID=176282 RepID=Q6TAB4_UNCXX|nr:hypothetical protein [symbiont bacterium of Paederus fuscipes]